MSTIEQGYGPNLQEKQKPTSKLKAGFMRLLGRGPSGPAPDTRTEAEIWGPTPEHLKTDAEKAEDARKADMENRYAEVAAKNITETYKDPNSTYNRGIDNANAYKDLAVDATMQGDIEKASSLTKTMRDKHDFAIAQARSQMANTGHSLVGREEVMDKLHEQALDQAEKEGVDIKTPENHE